MKLATYKDGSRDGQLVVVSRDLATAHYASGIASRLQQVLDDWNFLSPQLEELSTTLNHGRARHAFAFEPAQCMAPLPRAYQWVEASAYPGHDERLLQSRGAEPPPGRRKLPPWRHGASDDFAGPRDSIACAAGAGGVDVQGGLAVVTGDLAMGTAPGPALDAIRLVMLSAGLQLAPPDDAADAAAVATHAGVGLATAFGPVAVTPDELGVAWQGGRVHLKLDTACRAKRIGLLDAAPGMAWHFGQLLAQLCKTRRLRAGGIVGSGPVSAEDLSLGHASLAEKRAAELLAGGTARTPWLQPGDALRIEMQGSDGHSVFGSIALQVVAAD